MYYLCETGEINVKNKCTGTEKYFEIDFERERLLLSACECVHAWLPPIKTLKSICEVVLQAISPNIKSLNTTHRTVTFKIQLKTN